jgi:carbamoyltransferase
MTLALTAKPAFVEAAPSAVHHDGTTRPQVIDPDSDPWMDAVLQSFEQQTGCPALINTSFNSHRDPIVCSIEDAMLTAVAAGLDAIVLGRELTELR